MKDVARLAKVSAMTVSRALASPSTVAPATRTRIEQVIESTGYIPHLVASSLSTDRTRGIGVVVPTIADTYFAEFVNALTSVVTPYGYRVLLGDSEYSRATEDALIRDLLARRVDGLVLTGFERSVRSRQLVARSHIPVVETWDLSRNVLDMAVGFSNFDASYQMVQYLASRGHTKIAFVGAADDGITLRPRSAKRLAGYRQAVHDLNLCDDLALTMAAPPGMRAGAAALLDTVAGIRDVSAAFFVDDAQACGAILECQRQGWPVPSRIAIAGFGDIELASEIIPTLTTVRLPRHEMGRQAGTMVMDRLVGRSVASQIIDVGFTIVPRQSA
jgi:LacI family gluconate utilization system Gnt-I transcriptional repressor